MSKEYFDLIVVVPLEEEIHAVMEIFPGISDRSTPNEFRYAVDGGSNLIKMLVVQQEGMGKAHAAQAVSSSFQDFSAGMVVCVGIAGSLTDDMRLGDVCYSGSIIDVYDNIKASDNLKGQLDFGFSPHHYSTPREITSSMNFVRTLPALKPLYEDWQRQRLHAGNRLLSHPVPGRSNRLEVLGEPKSRNGTIVCGAVSGSENYNNKLRAIDRKLLALETESGGVFERAQMLGIPALTIRGISDYADANKASLEAESAGNIRRIAGLNAASFLRLQLHNDRFVDALLRLRQAKQEYEGASVAVSPLADLSLVLQSISTQVDERLRELSPEYRLQPKGYCLPIPRVREVNFASAIDEPEEAEPTDVRDVLQRRRSVLITMPRNYPDQSLAWVFGEDLLTVEIGGKQALPFVIDGSKIAPPRNGLVQGLSLYGAVKPTTLSEGQVVFIIEDVPIRSETKAAFLIKEMDNYPEAKFVFITRNDVNIVADSEFVIKAGAGIFKICDISFLEIAHFVQKKF
jgi:nucleoside phosphorylase